MSLNDTADADIACENDRFGSMGDMAEFFLTESEASFQRAILASPNNFTPRLVYADWLDEHDRSIESQLLRLEAELHTYPIDDPRRASLRSRVWDLQREYDVLWQQRLPILRGVVWGQVVHGVLNRVQLSLNVNAVIPEGLFAFLPMMQLHIDRLTPRQAARLANRAELRSLVALSASSRELTEDALVALLESPHLTSLATLQLNSMQLGDRTTETISKSPALTGLQRLDLSGNTLSGVSGRLIAGSTTLIHLRSLSLYRNDLGDMGIVPLADAPHLRSLESLELMNTQMGDRGIERLTQTGILQSVREINLCYNQIADRGAIALAKCAEISGKRLILRSNHIGDIGAMALAESTVFDPATTHLELGSNRFHESAKLSLDQRYGDHVHW